MATEFQMPKLGLTMEEGTILEWLVADGATVTDGTAVMRIETDKVETEVVVSADGTLHQYGQVGDTFRCGAVIGVLLAAGEAAPTPRSVAAAVVEPASIAAPEATGTASAAAVPPPDDRRRFISPNARRVAAERKVDVYSVVGTGPGGRVVSEDVEAAALQPVPVVRRGTASAPATTGPRVTGSASIATAAARQLADLLGIDLAGVAPDPLDGRITRDGVARYVRARLAPPAPRALPAPTAPPASNSAAVEPPPASQTPTRVVRLSGMRGTIAKRMQGSLQTMAQLTLTMDAAMDAVVADRSARKADGVVPGFTDYVIAAVARALRNHPMANAQVTTEGIAVLPDIHVGLAVALDDGLMVPVVRHADRLSLADLSTETTRLATGARSGTLAMTEFEGGTFSVTALGMFGVDAFTPVINPPNAAILGVGRLRDDLVLRDGVVVTTKRLTLSLTWDHRVLDGAPAAEFCRDVVALLAAPTQLG